MKRSYILLGVAMILAISGCCNKSMNPDPFQGQSARRIYQTGNIAYAQHQYSQAIQAYEALNKLYPYSSQAIPIQLKLMYSLYETGRYEAVLDRANQFKKFHPTNSYMDAAYYLKGCALMKSSYKQSWMLLSDRSERDLEKSQEALDNFQVLLSQFPRSPYAPAAKQQISYLRNLMACYETNIADYYLRKHAYVAAANRAYYVQKHYPDTKEKLRALAILREAYCALNLGDLA